MHIRTFRAASLQDALEEIRNQMGTDASVLHTRQVRDGWMGWLGRTYVEVTAGLRGVDDAKTPDDSIPQADAEVPVTVPIRSGYMQAEPTFPGPFEGFREQLIDAGVSPKTALRWLKSTESFTVGLGDSINEPWMDHLQRSIARELRIGGPIRTQPGAKHIVALVGPTGVGKTTTIAKLAAGFRIQERRRVGLVTIDTFRIAAVQQLEAYAEIMDLPMEVVENPSQMQPAIERLGDVDLVLLDTAGRSPSSDARIDQLVELLRMAQPDETHLVMAATSSSSTIQSVLKGFAPAHPTAAILTKLDEATSTAGVLSAITASDDFAGIPLSYLTNGQQVPDDIQVASAEPLLSRLLPGSFVTNQMEAA
ncbi:Flagellar biosynthesis protein FlhF [Planctomycetes bacterium CA13]|uniref:Flagellar biosynthesis protein FlhF n=1 Tax=Novipirellula herctigrandis TaxID=2527986 RepID=A0A5C5Z966_9BACT|nr:Flagellar biosynthesis protein FlhF [Planctomycetes bacterium CA13]